MSRFLPCGDGNIKMPPSAINLTVTNTESES
ncbi:hypothetical protein M2366_001028 [Aeromonas sp. BIGb0405]|jgi:hypothetical protein|nr:hypothetical protein [Aeromonas sp. BIGb0405]MCS3457941.1 hypothetical protein [Aeromonas sp. BIGb0445]